MLMEGSQMNAFGLLEGDRCGVLRHACSSAGQLWKQVSLVICSHHLFETELDS